jgi:hypothetical protein
MEAEERTSSLEADPAEENDQVAADDRSEARAGDHRDSAARFGEARSSFGADY